MNGWFYSLHLHYTVGEDPLSQNEEGGDRHFMTVADPCPDLESALRMAWFCLGKYGGDYGLLYFEESADVLEDEEGVWTFEPRYRLTAPNREYGSITDLRARNASATPREGAAEAVSGSAGNPGESADAGCARKNSWR